MNFGKRLRNFCSLWLLRQQEKWIGQHQSNKIAQILGGHIFFQTLVAAVRLELFTQLSRQPGMTLSQIASKLGIEEKPARILLLGCVSIGLLQKKKEYFFNSSISEKNFNKDNPLNLIPILEWQNFIAYRALYYFTEAIKKNENVGLKEFDGEEKTLYERLAHYPNLEAIYQNAMESTSQMANWMLQKYVDFSRYKFLLDVGGGNGANIIAIARITPALRACVFDLSSVCKIAEAKIQESGFTERLTTYSGNCFDDQFPKGVDCILFAHFLNLWSEEESKYLLRKAFATLPSSGSVIVFSLMQSDGETGPLTAAIVSPYFLTLTSGRGMAYTWSEYEYWMREAGFIKVSRMKMVRDHGAIIGTK
jgi:ubiquinone/menaquinone biosynthesis C-methylase UbiE